MQGGGSQGRRPTGTQVEHRWGVEGNVEGQKCRRLRVEEGGSQGARRQKVQKVVMEGRRQGRRPKIGGRQSVAEGRRQGGRQKR